MIHPWLGPCFHRIGAWPVCVGVHSHRHVGLWSVCDQVVVSIALYHDPPMWRTSSPPLWCITRLFEWHYHRRLVVWSNLDEDVLSVGLLIETTVMILWSRRIIGWTGVVADGFRHRVMVQCDGDEAFIIVTLSYDAVVLTTQERRFNTKWRPLRNGTVSGIDNNY